MTNSITKICISLSLSSLSVELSTEHLRRRREREREEIIEFPTPSREGDQQLLRHECSRLATAGTGNGSSRRFCDISLKCRAFYYAWGTEGRTHRVKLESDGFVKSCTSNLHFSRLARFAAGKQNWKFWFRTKYLFCLLPENSKNGKN